MVQSTPKLDSDMTPPRTEDGLANICRRAYYLPSDPESNESDDDNRGNEGADMLLEEPRVKTVNFVERICLSIVVAMYLVALYLVVAFVTKSTAKAIPATISMAFYIARRFFFGCIL
ncbi:hypothetical protein BZA77DRAFT_314791 [Pyronema omphalodes]|nr:hypothetical protein BZA77DRAFT_314791 [Pyronema omphalodes]